MTKALFYTDYHLANQRPINRCDEFTKNQLRKLKEIYDTAIEHKVDCVLFGGDFFNTHRIYSYELIHEALEIISNSGIVTYAAQGQHDLIGHNRESYHTSTLAFLERYSRGTFKTLWEPISVGDFGIHVCHWFDDLDEVIKRPKAHGKNSVLVCHKSITMKKTPFPTILTSDIKSDFDLVLSGDIHSGHPIHKIDKTIFFNPGSVTRMSVKDKERLPKIALIESGDEIKVTEMLLKTAQLDVFNTNILDELPDTPEMDDDSNFFNEIMELEKDAADLPDLIQKIATQKGIPRKVCDYISSKLVKA